MEKVIVFGGALIKPQEYTLSDTANSVFVEHWLDGELVRIEYKRLAETNLFYAEDRLGSKKREKYEFELFVKIVNEPPK